MDSVDESTQRVRGYSVGSDHPRQFLEILSADSRTLIERFHRALERR